MKVLVLLEFGIPPYREFLFNYLNNHPEIEEFLVVHSGQKFPELDYEFDSKEVKTFKFFSFYFHRNVINIIKNYDVVISSFHIFRPMCYLPAIWVKKKWIFWMTGVGRNSFPNLNKLLRSFFINRANSLIVYTENAKKEVIINWDINPKKIKVANNTLKITNSEFLNSERTYFLYVGRIQKRKGILKAIKAFEALKREYSKEILFKIVGDGEYKKELQAYVSSKDLKKEVVFESGSYDDEILKSHYENAIAYLSPDHVGLGVVHSFSYGVPVITCKNKDHAEEFNYCSPDNSILYDNDAQLPSVLKKLLDDKNISKQKGLRAYSFYENNLSFQHMNKVFIDAILE